LGSGLCWGGAPYSSRSFFNSPSRNTRS
jgi:hypothetical protein